MRALATNFGEKITTADPTGWAEEAKLNWHVDEHEVIVDGKAVEGSKALVNSDTGTVLNIVSDKYNVVQPIDMLDTFHHAVDRTGFKMDRMGVYGDGKVIWGRADMEQAFSLNGNDNIDYFMYFVTSTDGSTATHAFISTLRAACMNALNIASKQSDIGMKVFHRSEYDVHEFGSRLDYIDIATGEFEEKVSLLSDRQFDGYTGFNRIYSRLFGDAPREEGRSQTMWNNRKADAWANVFTNPGVELTNQFSLWNLLNAFTFNIDHKNKARNDESAHRHTIMRAGAKEKLRIMDTLVGLVEAA